MTYSGAYEGFVMVSVIMMAKYCCIELPTEYRTADGDIKWTPLLGSVHTCVTNSVFQSANSIAQWTPTPPDGPQ